MSTSIVNPMHYGTWVETIKEMRLKTPQAFQDDKQCFDAAAKLCLTSDGPFSKLHFRTAFKWDYHDTDGKQLLETPKRVEVKMGTSVHETAFRLRYGWTKDSAHAVIHDGGEGYFASFGDPFVVYPLRPETSDDWSFLDEGAGLVMVYWSKERAMSAQCKLVADIMRPKDRWHEPAFNSDLLQARPKKNGKELTLRLKPLELHDEQFIEKWFKKQALEAVKVITNSKPDGGGPGGGATASVAAAGPAPAAAAEKAP